MKRYRLKFELTRREDNKLIYGEIFIYDPYDTEYTEWLKIILASEVDTVYRAIEKDAKGVLSFGHLRVAAMIGSALEIVSEAIAIDLPGEHIFIRESKVDMATNYVMKLTLTENLAENMENNKPSIFRRFMNKLKGVKND